MVEKAHTAAGNWWPQMLEPLREFGGKVADFFAPSADAAVSGDFYEINVELPGVAQEDINVTMQDNMLTVSGEKRFAREEKTKEYFFSERAFGRFQRSFRLPGDVDTAAINAAFKDGVRTLRVPKPDPPPDRSRRVEVQSG